MEELLKAYDRWLDHAAGCAMCRLFDSYANVRCVCKEGRGLLVQILQLLDGAKWRS